MGLPGQEHAAHDPRLLCPATLGCAQLSKDEVYETVDIVYRDQLTLFQLAVDAMAQLIAAKEYAEKLTEKDQELAAARQEIAQAEQRADYAQDELLGQIAANGIEELPVVIRPLAPGPLVAEPVKLLRHATSAVLIIDITKSGRLKTAFLGGYGARLTYGLASMLDFEGELVYAKSGTVSFGDVERSASLLRIQGGVLLRFGKTICRLCERG